MESKSLKSLYIEAGTEKYTKISVYKKDKLIGYLTDDGHITEEEGEAGWFNIKGDAKEEFEAITKFGKRYPFFEIEEAKGKKAKDWDY